MNCVFAGFILNSGTLALENEGNSEGPEEFFCFGLGALYEMAFMKKQMGIFIPHR